MPSGCPEQTFYSFIPNIAAMWYLNSTGKLTDDDRASTKKHIDHGLAEILTRQNNIDGSFAFWNGKSVWLTAYVAKILAHIKTLTYVDAKVIAKALQFLVTQEKNGGFLDPGMVLIKNENDSSDNVKSDTLSAFIAISFLENKRKDSVGDFSGFQGTVDNILSRVIKKISTVKDHHIKAMYAYAFALNKDKSEAEAWLQDLMRNKRESENKIYWDHNERTLMIETAAYALMAYVEIGEHL